MREREGHIEGVKKLSLFWRAWLPERVDAVVIIAHGVAEHSGRYARLAKVLVEHHCAVYAIDHRGHGKSQGVRAMIEKFDFTVQDLDRLFRLVHEQHPAHRPFLIGHSLGGAIALSYALRHQDKLKGLILSAPAVQLPKLPWKVAFLARFYSQFTPTKPFFPIDGATISRDPAEVRAYNEDPLNHRGAIPARTLVELLDRIAWLPAGYAAIRLPLLVMHGSADALVPFAAAQRVHDETGSKDKTLKRYEGCYHEIFNELPEARQRVFDDLSAWIAAHQR